MLKMKPNHLPSVLKLCRAGQPLRTSLRHRLHSPKAFSRKFCSKPPPPQTTTTNNTLRFLAFTSAGATLAYLSSNAYGHSQEKPNADDTIVITQSEEKGDTKEVIAEEVVEVDHGGLGPDRFEEVEVVCNKPLSRVHMLLRLQLKSPKARLNYPLGGIVEVRALTKTIDEVFPFGKFVSGFYVPVSFQSKQGHFDLIYKVHDVEEEGNLLKPERGISQHLASLRPKDTMEVRGPFRVIKGFPPKHEEEQQLHYGRSRGR